MPTNTYMNPGSFAPQVQNLDFGPLGGLLFADQYTDQRQIMEKQHLLQQLGLERATQEQKEFMGGIPLRQLEQQGKEQTLQGQMPFLRELAGATAQRGIQEQNFIRDTQFGAEAQVDFFRKLRQSASDDEWKNYGREIQAGFQIISEAQNIRDNQGELAAQAHIQQAMQSLKARGINLPQSFADPNNWAAIRRASADSLEHIRNVEIEQMKGAYSLEGQRLRNQGDVDAAHARAGIERNQNLDQHMAFLMRRINDAISRGEKPNPEDEKQFAQHVGRKWDAQFPQRADLQMLNMTANGRDPARAKEARAALEKAKTDFFAGYGLTWKPGPNPKPQGGSGDAPARLRFDQLPATQN